MFSNDVNISRVKRVWEKIKAEMSTFINEWYNIIIGEKTYQPISVLRNKDGLPLQFTFKDGRKTSIKDIPEELAKEFCDVCCSCRFYGHESVVEDEESILVN